MGAVIILDMFEQRWLGILIAMFSLLIARAISVYGLLLFFAFFKKLKSTVFIRNSYGVGWFAWCSNISAFITNKPELLVDNTVYGFWCGDVSPVCTGAYNVFAG